MKTLVNPKVWEERLLAAQVPRVVVSELCTRYPLVSLTLVTSLLQDDQQCGISFLAFGRSPDCAEHDARMLCASHGYPVGSEEETALELIEDSSEVGIRGLRDFALWPFKILIGAPVGWVMDRIRSLRVP